MVPAGMDPSANSPHLAALDEQLSIASRLLHHDATDTDTPLPIGVGFLTLLATADAYRANALPILRRHRPAFVWLFGSDPAAYGELVTLFRDAGAAWGMRVFAQVGSVAAARAVVRCGVDVVVAQGCDAGGHQWADAAGVVTLVPEIVDALRGKEGVAVVAGGGIVDGRGVAAALALGAQGVTMGTRVSVVRCRGLFLESEKEREKEKERKRERKKERGREREREKEKEGLFCNICQTARLTYGI